MVNPIHVNPTFAERHLTVGASDWLWVVTVIMGISTLSAFAWASLVGLFPCLAWHVSHSTLPTGTARNTGVPSYGHSYSLSVYDNVLRHGVQLGPDARQDRIQKRAEAQHLRAFLSLQPQVCINRALNKVGAIYTVVYQRAAHPPHVTVDDRPSTVCHLPHRILHPRHCNRWARRRTHPYVVQVGLLYFWRTGAALRFVSSLCI
jgi:hypothetical protein